MLQLIREELKGFKAEYIRRMSYMEQRLVLVILLILEFSISLSPFLMLFAGRFNKVKLEHAPKFPWIFIFCMAFLMHFDLHYTSFYLGIIFGSLRVPYT